MGGSTWSRTHRSIIAALLIATVSTGCHKWVTVNGSPAKVIETQSPKKAQLVLTDSTVTLNAFTVRGDSIYGGEIGEAHRPAIALSDVTEIRLRKIDGGLSALAWVVTVGALADLLCALQTMRT